MNKQKLQQLAHLAGGLIIMVHGFETFEEGDFKASAGYLGASIAIMVLAGWHKTIVQRFLQGDVAFFLLEAMIMVYSAWHYKTKGSEISFYIMATFAVLFFLFSIISISKNSDMPRRSRRSKRKRKKSSLFNDNNAVFSIANAGNSQKENPAI